MVGWTYWCNSDIHLPQVMAAYPPPWEPQPKDPVVLVHSKLSLQVKLVTTLLVLVRGRGAVTPGGVPTNPAMIKTIV